ncbi:hypothetical protein BV25DRAFT_1867550 [Artomyces pyxidatus]|uniref:Uncharacterized protein n=1 Tax=Artomyces pyxidatus TaxID=48021 RepID=A0ACB8TH42_9AGAM|nr:hypothetical protein BV25DRAFT_1867550 [Artomyces pyxidatus]
MHDVVTTSPPKASNYFSSPDHTRPTTTSIKPTKPSVKSAWSSRDTNTMEDPTSDRRHQLNTSYSNQAVPQGLKYQTPGFINRNSPLDHNSSPDHSLSSESAVSAGGRWRLNSTGQLVNPEAENATWDLADEIVRLKISNGIDGGDELHGQMRTPPQSKKNSSAVVQLHDGSPLETSSDASLDSGSSPHPSDQHLVLPSHSRGSSTDTTSSSQISGSSHTLQSSALGLKVGNSAEPRDRPHSYSGGLSSADLRRLQNAGGSPLDADQPQQWSSGLMPDRQAQYDQTTYPSLSGYPRQQGPAEDLQVDYGMQQRQFQPLVDGSIPNASGFTRANGGANGIQYRSVPGRAFNPQMPNMMAANANVGYPAQPAHTAHLSLGNTQQLYDMMMPSHENPAVARVQQQHNVFRATHQHSASDPLHLREAAALLNGGLPPFAAPGMYPAPLAPPQAMGMYANQYYAPQDVYAPGGVSAQVMAAARLQQQYPGPYGVMPAQGLGGGVGTVSPNGSLVSVNIDPNGNGPSANNRKLGLYKTELCRSWEEKGACRYGPKCQFAHGEDEIRKVSRHPKYKTEICRTFWVSGSCPYGKRCCFIHTELPASGAPPGADGAPPPKVTETRGRSDSDSNEPSVSLLARISAKRNQDAVNAAHNGELPGSTNNYQPPATSRPPTGSLRVDTSSLDSAAVKQHHKSAYPSFAANGILYPSNEGSGNVSPGPVTAGPDLGRQRGDFVNYGQSKQTGKGSSSNGNARHSFNGSDVSINLSTPPTASGHSSPFAVATPDNTTARPNGHARSGSAGNWGNFSRSGHLAAPSPFHGPQSASPGNEGKLNTPWLSTESGSGSRFAEKAWA